MAKVYSIQPRYRSVDGAQAHGSWAMIRSIMQMGSGNIPPYGMIERDAYLSYSWQDEPMTAGAFSTWIEKLQTVQWNVRGGKVNATSFAKMITDSNWPVLIGELGLDYLVCDKGSMLELGRARRGSTNGRVLGMQQIDPTRMVYTGNVGSRWRFYPSIPTNDATRKGAIDMPDENMIVIRSMPLGRDRFRGLGYSPLSRLLDAKKLMVGYLTYFRQEIGELPPELAIIVNGLSATEVEDSLAKYKLDREAKGLSEYPKVWWLGSDDPTSPVQITVHGLTTPNKAFRYEQMVEWWIKTLALNTGEDVGEYWLIQHSGATKASQSVQAAKSRGKGTARFMSDMEGQINNDVMPFGTFFTFDNPDDEQDAIRAEILSVNVNSLKAMSETMIGGAAGTGGDPVFAKEEIRMLAVDMGVMPEELGAENVPHMVGSVLKSIADGDDNWIVGPDGRASQVKPKLNGKEARDAMLVYHRFKEMFGSFKGGAGSGHHGHAGRPGKRGGSLPGDGSARRLSKPADDDEESAPGVSAKKVGGYDPKAKHVYGDQDVADDVAYAREDIAYLAEELGKTPEEIETAILDNLREYVSNGDIGVRTDMQAAESILADERFKNQFESGVSNGALDFEARETIEGRTGVPHGTKAEDRPIYGYIAAGFKEEAHIEQYGNVEFVMKPEVADRSTFTVGDSLDQQYDVYQAASPVRNPGLESIGNNYEAMKTLYQGGSKAYDGYHEVHIHKGVKLADVSKVYVRIGPGTNVDESQAHALVDKFNAAGVDAEIFE